MKIFKFSFLYLIGALFLFNACVDDEFDTPPEDGVPADITANTTIAELKAMHTLGSFEEIKDDIIVSGIVIADDRSGNFFRQLVIQDTTAGIELRINETDLFNEYGVGRRVYVRCQGLWLGDFNGVTQLGAGLEPDDRGGFEISRIPAVLLRDFLVKGLFNQTVTPRVTTIAGLRSSDISTLVTIEDAQFLLATCERTYARDFVTMNGTRVQESLNQEIEACSNGNTIILRSSGFSNFANQALPNGSGSITAVYTVFNTDFAQTDQLIIRDPSDVNMTGARCGSGGVDGELKTLAEMRDLFTGAQMDISQNWKVTGTVISDVVNSNTTNRNMIIQDASGGIVIRFTDGHNFGIGEIVEVNITGATLSEFRGLLQIDNVRLEQAFTTCDIGEIEPRVATVQEILNNADAWESTLIKIEDAVISGGATFGGGTTVTDATNSISMFTQSFASFASAPLPIGEVDITAMVGDFDGVQLNIRNLQDVEGGDVIGDPDDADIATIRSMFSGATTNIGQNIQITGVVVSDLNAGNMQEQNLAIQDGTAGIIVRFSESHPYQLGEQLTITVRGLELSEFRTLLQINNVPLTAVTSSSAGTLPAPRVTTVAEILANGEAWESTVVQINNATISGSNTFEGTTMVADGTGTISMFTRGAADFSGNAVPANPVTLTGLVSEFDGSYQVGLRNAGDIQ